MFAETGPIARALPGFEARPGQLTMAAASRMCSPTAGSCLPRRAPARARRSPISSPRSSAGERVLVSTGTKNLQEQIFYKDLPVLKESLGMPFTATYMKGRGNYLCLHRFEASRNGGTAHPSGLPATNRSTCR